MKTKIFLLTVLILASLLSACNQAPSSVPEVSNMSAAPTLTPEDQYVQAVVPALAQLEQFFNEGPLVAVDALLDATGSQGTTNRLDLFMCFSRTAPGPCAWDDLAPLGGLYDPVVSQSFDLLATFSGLTPPSEISTYHEQIEKCLYHNMRKAQVIMELTASHITPDDSSLDQFACQLLDHSITRIKEYVQNQ